MNKRAFETKGGLCVSHACVSLLFKFEKQNICGKENDQLCDV